MRRLILAVSLVTATNAFAQAAPVAVRPNGIDLELLGNGVLASLNYDRLVAPTLVLRIGLSNWEIDGCFLCDVDENSKFTGVPISLAHLSGKGASHFELGGGLLVGTHTRTTDPGTPDETKESSTIVDLTGIVGYRHQAPGGRFYWRLALTPFLSLTKGGEGAPVQGFTPSVGLSWGVRF